MLPDDAIPDGSAVRRGAGFGIRFLARLIDTILGLVLGFGIGIVVGIVFFLLARAGLMRPDWAQQLQHFSILGVLVSLLGAWMYHTVVEGVASSSVGKLMCGLWVVDLQGRPIGVGAALKRGLAYHWDALFLGLVGYESMRKTPLRQRYGDVWAKTIVVSKADGGPTPAVPASRAALGVLAGLAVWSAFLALNLCIRMV